jgi:hypothetical protein
LRRVNEANETSEDIQNSDKEYFEKLRGDENESMAGQEANGIVEVQVEIDEYRFSDGQAVLEIKQEPVEVKQEERPPVRSLAHVQRMQELEKCKGSGIDSNQVPDAGAVTESCGKENRNEQEDDALMQNSDENQATKEIENAQQESEHRSEQTALKLRKCRAEFKEVFMEQTKSKKTQNPNRKVFQCHICSKSFARKSNFQVHIEAVHEKKKRFKCSQCSKEFYSKQHLQIHMATHEFSNDDTSNSNRPFRCDYNNCGKFYKSEKCLREHKKIHDSNRIKCPKCSKDFSSTKNLRLHIQEVHDKKTRFECDFCPKVFFSRNSIGLHLRHHLISKRKTPKTFPKPAVMSPLHCPICFKLLSSKHVLQVHIDTVHEKKVKFACDLCPRQFYNKSHLMNHMATHIFRNDDTFNSDRPFKCNFKNCGKFYKNQDGLRTHQKAHSGKCDFVLERPAVDFLIPLDLRPFKCHCGAAFKRSRELKIHQMTKYNV